MNQLILKKETIRSETVASLLVGLETNPLPPARTRNPRIAHAPTRVHNLRLACVRAFREQRE